MGLEVAMARRPLLPLLVLASLASPRIASACGQSTHVHIGIHTVSHLPEGSDLRAILEDPARFDWLVNGAMFPDGGYSPLTQDDYGEIAHWEPFQHVYMQWIGETYAADLCSDEALDHVTLALGMMAHGMADQVYDSLYLERSLLIEPDKWAGPESVDKATDVAFTAEVGPQPIPEDVLPYDTLSSIFDRYGHTVSGQTIAAGQASLRLAVSATSSLGQDPEAVQRNIDYFPWATQHLVDERFPGAPTCIGEVVAPYWQAQWDRLHGRFDDTTQWVVWTWPEAGATGHETDHRSIDSQVALVFGKTVTVADVDAADLTWTDADGTAIPFSRRMYYGNNSNVLLLRPQANLAPATQQTIAIGTGMKSSDGSVLSTDVSWSFTTADTVPADTDDPPDPAVDGPGKGGLFAAPSLSTQPAACPDRVPAAADSDTDGAPDTSGPGDTSCGACAGSGSPELAWPLLLIGLLARRRQPSRG